MSRERRARWTARCATPLLCVALAMLTSGCVSSEQQSAAIAKRADRAAAQAHTTVKAGAANRAVKASHVTLLSVAGRTAVALQLLDGASAPQVDVPVLINVTGAGGKSLFENNTQGLEPSLQQMAALAPGRPAWWVDDQVLTADKPTAVKAQIGAPHAAAAARTVPSIAVTGLQQGSTGGLDYLQGNVVNHSSVAQTSLPVFAVALRGGRVVAAGRSLVASLPASKNATAQFQIFWVGSAKGAQVQVTVAPTRL